MPIKTVWDLVDGAERRFAIQENGYDVRSGRVTGLTSANTTPWEALTDAVVNSDSPPPYDHPDARLSAYKLYDVIVRGETSTTARIWCRYQPVNFSGSPVEKLAIECGGGEQYEQVEKNPLTAERYVVNLPGLTLESSPAVLDLDTADSDVCLVSMGYPRELTVLTLYGLFGSVPESLHRVAKKVNANAWPPPTPAAIAQGIALRPRGHWRAAPLRTRWSQRDGRYALALSLYSKGDQPGEDWSSYTFATDPNTGKKLAPNATLMQALINQTYQKGLRNNIAGVLKDGQFDVIDYSLLAPLLNNSPLRASNPIGSFGGFGT